MNKEAIKEAIKIIRKSPNIGRGSCSHIDECYTDEDLAGQFEGMSGTKEMVAWAFGTADMLAEQESNAWQDADTNTEGKYEKFSRALVKEWQGLWE